MSNLTGGRVVSIYWNRESPQFVPLTSRAPCDRASALARHARHQRMFSTGGSPAPTTHVLDQLGITPRFLVCPNGAVTLHQDPTSKRKELLTTGASKIVLAAGLSVRHRADDDVARTDHAFDAASVSNVCRWSRIWRWWLADQAARSRTVDRSEVPSSVKEYSTRGGTSA